MILEDSRILAPQLCPRFQWLWKLAASHSLLPRPSPFPLLQAILSHGVLAGSQAPESSLQLIFKTTLTCVILIPVLLCIEPLHGLGQATFPLDLSLLSFPLMLLVYTLVPKCGLCISTSLSWLMHLPGVRKGLTQQACVVQTPHMPKKCVFRTSPWLAPKR